MLETIVSIIRQAGALLLSAHAKERDISSKEGKANFVTKYDIAVQQFLQQRLQAAFPSAAFLGEEGGASQLKKSGDTFIVDPIDGTTKFHHRLPPQQHFHRSGAGWADVCRRGI